MTPMYAIKNRTLVVTTCAEIPPEAMRRLTTLSQIGRRFGRDFTGELLANLNESPGDESAEYGLETLDHLPEPRLYLAELVLGDWNIADNCNGEWAALVEKMENADGDQTWPSTKAEKELAAQFLAACGALDTKAARRIGKKLSAVVGSRLGIP